MTVAVPVAVGSLPVMVWVVTFSVLKTWRMKPLMIVVAVLSFLEHLVTAVGPVTLEPCHAAVMVKY